jgi:ribosomal protein S18 acetylase RimI-like enzyme
MASFPPDEQPPADADASASVARWLDGWVDGLGVGCEDNGVLVGAAWARHGEPVLVRDETTGEPLAEVIIGIAPEARGAGVGTSLIADLVARAAAAGCVGLSLTVSEANRAAIRLYDGAGFVTRGRTSTGQLVMVWQP